MISIFKKKEPKQAEKIDTMNPKLKKAMEEFRTAHNFYNYAYGEAEFKLAIARISYAEAIIGLILSDSGREMKSIQSQEVKEKVVELKKKRGVA